MNRRKPLLGLLILTGVLLPAAGSAWTENGVIYIVSDARHLMPENLQWVLGNFQDSLMAGLNDSPSESRSIPGLVQAILDESKRGISHFNSPGSYPEGVRSMGRIARMIAALNHPLNHVPAIQNENWRTDYDIFLDKNRLNFRIRWPGIDGRPRSEGELTGVLNHSVSQSQKVSKLLIKTFETNDIPIGSYDVRSIPFGIGSIAYSRSVANTALSWLFIWDQVGGIKSTPYKPSAGGKSTAANQSGRAEPESM